MSDLGSLGFFRLLCCGVGALLFRPSDLHSCLERGGFSKQKGRRVGKSSLLASTVVVLEEIRGFLGRLHLATGLQRCFRIWEKGTNFLIDLWQHVQLLGVSVKIINYS